MSGEPSNNRVVIAGGSGFLGVSLAHHLAGLGSEIVVLSRAAPKCVGPWRHVVWDARSVGAWRKELDGASGLINLTGRTVDCVKTPDHCDEILRSRVESTAVLGKAMGEVSSPPRVWVQMSTAHIYGDPPRLVCDEDSALGYGLAPTVGRAWEEAYHASVPDGIRKVVLRTSFVIGRDRGAGGGALSRLRLLVRLGLGGRVGSGEQGMSWIHETDMNRVFEWALSNPGASGVYIASAPNPVSQRRFMESLRGAMGVPIGLPAPAWLVRLGARFVLRTDPELALFGRYVVPRRLREAGFEFRFPTLDEACAELFQKTVRA